MERCVQVVAKPDTSKRCDKAEETVWLMRWKLKCHRNAARASLRLSFNSVHFNKNQLVLMAELEMQAGNNSIVIPYKIDTRSVSNIMPLFIFKKLFKNITEDQLKKTMKSHIRLRTYNNNKHHTIRDVHSPN